MGCVTQEMIDTLVSALRSMEENIVEHLNAVVSAVEEVAFDGFPSEVQPVDAAELADWDEEADDWISDADDYENDPTYRPWDDS